MVEKIAEKPKRGWFHPQTLLDWSYEIGIIGKGLNGTLEIVGGILLLALPTSMIEGLFAWLAGLFSSDPTTFIARNLLQVGNELATGGTTAALVFFLPHGLVKVGLVIALLRQKLWAYPWALFALTLFLIYQVYLVIAHQTFLMGFLVVLDIVIIWLVWREWEKVTGRKPDPTA